MSDNLFNLLWFLIFLLIILIAFLANILIICAILSDRSMHTSTYFYIINVNIADILLVLSCLPERVAQVSSSNNGFRLGMFTCKVDVSSLIRLLANIDISCHRGFLFESDSVFPLLSSFVLLQTKRSSEKILNRSNSS